MSQPEDLQKAIHAYVDLAVQEALQKHKRNFYAEDVSQPCLLEDSDYHTQSEWRDLLVEHAGALRERLGNRPNGFPVSVLRHHLENLVELKPGDMQAKARKYGSPEPRWHSQLSAVLAKRWIHPCPCPVEKRAKPRGYYHMV